jgi:hypothetical protein
MLKDKNYIPKIILEKQQLRGGKGDKTTPKDVNKKELKLGKKVEKEHTKNKEKRQEIALDHLTEDPKYYSKLKKSKLVDEHFYPNLY